MYEIIIATHGSMAQGMKDSLTMFTDKINHVHTISLDEEGINKFENEAIKLIETVKDHDTLVLCDIGFATPFNIFAKNAERFHKNVEIIAGFNMPALLEAVIMQHTSSLDEITQSFVNSIRPVSLNKQLSAVENSDDE